MARNVIDADVALCQIHIDVSQDTQEAFLWYQNLKFDGYSENKWVLRKEISWSKMLKIVVHFAHWAFFTNYGIQLQKEIKLAVNFCNVLCWF